MPNYIEGSYPMGEYFILKPYAAWLEQATEAWQTLKDAASSSGSLPAGAPLRDFQPLDPDAFGRMIQAMDALTPYTGIPVAAETRRLAGLVELGELLGPE